MATGRIDDRISPGYQESVRPACNIDSNTPVVESQEHPGYYEVYLTVLESVSLNQDSASMAVGETLTLEPVFHGVNGAQVPAEEQGVTWTSSDPDVVMVDVNGTIKALKEGTATITVTTDVGQKTAKCEVTVRHTHAPVETEGKAATCTEEGSKSYYTCNGCGKFFEDEECTKEITDLDTWKILEPLNHSFTDYVYNNDATCTANGTETAKCDRCDETDTREKADTALGHNTVKTEARSATCTKDGNKEYWTCENCGKYFSDAEGNTEIFLADTVISAAGHKPVRTEAKAATCTEDGNIEYWVCETCGEYFSDGALTQKIEKKDTVIEATGHGETELKNEKEATCTAKGYTGDKICTVCGEVLEKGQVIPMPAHSYKDGKCTACGASDPDYRPAVQADPTAPDKGQGNGDKDGAAPGTNDPNSLTLWLLLLVTSGCTLTGALAYSRRRNH